MIASTRTLYALSLLLLFPSPLYAQDEQAPPSSAYNAEYSLIESVFGTLVRIIHDVTLQNEGNEVGERLREMAQRLSTAAPSLQTAPLQPLPPAPVRPPLTTDDLAQLERLLYRLHEEVRDLHDRLVAEASYDLAAQLAPIEERLEEAAGLAYRLAYAPGPGDQHADAEHARWLEPGDYGPGGRVRGEADRPWEETRVKAEATGREEARDEEKCCKRHRRHGSSFGSYSDAGTFVGEFPYRWPYHETSLYRSVPAIRYNRVEGLVLGVGLPPLGWDDYARSRLFGQLGYAFALKGWRYEVGIETRVERSRNSDYGVKLGGAYRRNTATNDLWKSNWLENSLAAFFFEYDFFDYYEVEGWTLYAAQRLTPLAQLSAGYRAETYRSLDRNTGWSLFGGHHFRPNPSLGPDEGRMHSFVFAFEGGRVAGLQGLPRGAAFRTEAELGQGLSGDFSFNRYTADGRLYVPVTPYSSLALRLRGGLAAGNVPFQKAFTLGGVGTVRAYPQNAFPGTRMLLANAEYILGDVMLLEDLFDDLQFFGFADAGWVNDLTFTEAGWIRTDQDAFDFDHVLPAAGFGAGLAERSLRLELAWPLRDLGYGLSPTLWFRLSPTF